MFNEDNKANLSLHLQSNQIFCYIMNVKRGKKKRRRKFLFLKIRCYLNGLVLVILTKTFLLSKTKVNDENNRSNTISIV